MDIVRLAAPAVGQDVQQPGMAPDVPPFVLTRDPTRLAHQMFGEAAAVRGVALAGGASTCS